jgi:cytochrome c oxidase assembly protein subunit 15
MLWLHRYNRFLAAVSLLLIAAGGLVTSTGSGLAVPDWPSTYGYFMYSFPLSGMVGGILYEHGHRLIASTVGLMTIVLTVWLTWVERRRWVRRLGWIVLAAVIAQGLLGGLTVLYFLPAPVSIGHAGLAQIFFMLVVSLAVFTSPGWLNRYGRDAATMRDVVSDTALRRLAILTPIVVYLQILVGATMRHTGAGLAIPDFPLAFGHVVPPIWDPGIAVHFAHRVGAVVVVGLVVALSAHVVARQRAREELVRPALLLLLVVLTQFTLGAWTVLSEKHVVINTTHVATGAVLFVTSVVLGLRVHRDCFDDRGLPAPDAPIRSAALTPHGSPGARV